MKNVLILSLALLLAACSPLAAYETSVTPAPTVTAPTFQAGTSETPTPTPLIIPAWNNCTVTAAEALNLRSGPGTKYTVKYVLKAGETVTRLPTTNGDWWKVATQDDLTGWIHSKFCKE